MGVDGRTETSAPTGGEGGRTSSREGGAWLYSETPGADDPDAGGLAGLVRLRIDAQPEGEGKQRTYYAAGGKTGAKTGILERARPLPDIGPVKPGLGLVHSPQAAARLIVDLGCNVHLAVDADGAGLTDQTVASALKDRHQGDLAVRSNLSAR